MAIVYLLAIVPYWSILPQEVFSTFCFGIILGYISYEMMHYYVHHGSPNKGTHLNDMKMYHL
jgi:4-hydroxysphinganine ceramide fatty acyl 2-hydroxylase